MHSSLHLVDAHVGVSLYVAVLHGTSRFVGKYCAVVCRLM